MMQDNVTNNCRTQGSGLPPDKFSTHPPSLTAHLTFHTYMTRGDIPKYSYDCNVIINIGSLVLLVHSKNITLLSFFHTWLICDTTVYPSFPPQKSHYFHCFSRKRSFQEYCGSGPGILNTDVGKWHFEECWIQY